jgi:hypothetical protein
VTTILLESAAIDIPVTIMVCVGVRLRWIYNETLVDVMVPAQVREFDLPSFKY